MEVGRKSKLTKQPRLTKYSNKNYEKLQGRRSAGLDWDAAPSERKTYSPVDVHPSVRFEGLRKATRNMPIYIPTEFRTSDVPLVHHQHV